MITKELSDFFLLHGCKAALAAGGEIMRLYSRDDINVSLKSDSSLITDADTTSHETIKEILTATRTPLLSEEGRNMLFEERHSWDLYWLVDPLDGTHEFVQKNDEFIVSIALMHKGKPEIGLILVPASGKLYIGSSNHGVWRLDATPDGYMDFKTVDEFLAPAVKIDRIERKGGPVKIAVTRSHMNEETRNKIEEYRAKYGEVEVIVCGSGLKFCLLADGAADIYMRTTPLYDWDIAAGAALMSQLGYRMKLLNGKDIRYNKQELLIDPFEVSAI